MIKKQGKDKKRKDIPDPSLLAVEPTAQYMSGKNTGREATKNWGKAPDKP